MTATDADWDDTLCEAEAGKLQEKVPMLQPTPLWGPPTQQQRLMQQQELHQQQEVAEEQQKPQAVAAAGAAAATRHVVERGFLLTEPPSTPSTIIDVDSDLDTIIDVDSDLDIYGFMAREEEAQEVVGSDVETVASPVLPIEVPKEPMTLSFAEHCAKLRRVSPSVAQRCPWRSLAIRGNRPSSSGAAVATQLVHEAIRTAAEDVMAHKGMRGVFSGLIAHNWSQAATLCSRVVDASLCQSFYVGATTRTPRERWRCPPAPHCETWSRMCVLFKTNGSDLARLERDLIWRFRGDRRCRNIGVGGERIGGFSGGGFVYVVIRD